MEYIYIYIFYGSVISYVHLSSVVKWHHSVRSLFALLMTIALMSSFHVLLDHSTSPCVVGVLMGFHALSLCHSLWQSFELFYC